MVDRAKAGKHEMIRYTPPAEEIARWNKVGGEPIQNDWVKKMEGKGVRDARDILDTTLQLLKQ